MKRNRKFDLDRVRDVGERDTLTKFEIEERNRKATEIFYGKKQAPKEEPAE